MIEVESFVDLHTHTRYPDLNNFPEKEIELAAENGGYSEILAMPNSEIVIDSLQNLHKAVSTDNKLDIKIHRTGALTKNLEGKELVNYEELIDHGVYIFSDDGKSLIDDDLANEAFEKIGKLGGAIFQHCEKNCYSQPGDIAPPNQTDSLIAINESEESDVLLRDIKLVEKYGTRYHAQHISSKNCVNYLREAKKDNLPISSEVTPHHLLINNEGLDISNGQFKMFPPIRTEEDRASLIEGLKDATIDVIATDHAPHPNKTKEVSFKEAAFPMLYSSNIFSIEELEKYLSHNPRKILSDIGYQLTDTKINHWQECNKKYTTKSKFNNSAFENTKTKIEKANPNV